MSTSPDISVLLCTHRPDPARLRATLDGLRRQTLPVARWELLVVDNASTPPLELADELAWHPLARVIREEKLGLTHARCAGISAAIASLLVFVDDDNVLDPRYLAAAVELADRRPDIGAFGGEVSPGFETEPAPELRPWLGVLALREVSAPRWAMYPEINDTLPCGAGLVVRAAVARRYLDAVRGDPVRAALDRRGDSLASCGDTDLALTAVDHGLGTGVFPELRLRHLIPARRVQPAYLLALIEDLERSRQVLCHLRGLPATPPPGLVRRLWNALNAWRHREFFHRVHAAVCRGRARAARDIAAVKEGVA
jgi:Predicted glycosyltransferases